MQFDVVDFTTSLNFWVLSMAYALGISLGIVVKFSHIGSTPPKVHFFWMISAGMVFFIPLAILKAFQSSPVWERFLSTLILWIIFSAGMITVSWIFKKD